MANVGEGDILHLEPRERVQEVQQGLSRQELQNPEPSAVQTNRADAGNRTLHAERRAQPTQGRGVDAGHAQRALIGAEAAGRTPATAAPAGTRVHHEERQD